MVAINRSSLMITMVALIVSEYAESAVNKEAIFNDGLDGFNKDKMFGIYLSINEFCDEEYLKSINFNPNDPKRKLDADDNSGSKKEKDGIKNDSSDVNSSKKNESEKELDSADASSNKNTEGDIKDNIKDGLPV